MNSLKEQMGWMPDTFHPEKFGGTYKPVKYGIMAGAKEQNEAYDSGEKRKREWAVRSIVGGVQAGELNTPDEIVKAATNLGVNDDPVIMNLYAAAQNKQPAEQPQENAAENSGLLKGVEAYRQTPEGKQDVWANYLARQLKGEISKEEFDATVAKNNEAYTQFANKLLQFSQSGEAQPDTAGTPPVFGQTPEETQAQAHRNAPPPGFNITAGMMGKIRPTEPQAAVTEEDRIKQLGQQRAKNTSDATRFSSAIGADERKTIDAEMSQYNRNLYKSTTGATAANNMDESVDQIRQVYDNLTEEEKNDDANSGIVLVGKNPEMWKSLGQTDPKNTARVVGQALANAKIRSTFAKTALEDWKTRQVQGPYLQIPGKVAQQNAMIPGKVTEATEVKTAENKVPQKIPISQTENLADIDNTISSLENVISKYPMGKGYSVPVVGGTIQGFRRQVDPDFSSWVSSLAGVVNNYMKAYSGTAVTANEMKRNIDRLGSANMTDEARVAVLKNILADIQREKDARVKSYKSGGYQKPNQPKGADYYLKKHGLK